MLQIRQGIAHLDLVSLSRRRGRALAATALALLALATVGAASAAAAPGWLPATDLFAAGENARLPQIAVDPQGDAVAVWRRDAGTKWIVQSATRPAGGSWSAAVDLSPSGEYAELPQIAVDPQGDAVAVWQRYDGSNWIVQSATRPAGGSWSAAVDLSASEQNAEYPQIAVDPQGDAVAVWQRYDGSSWIVQSATRPVGGSWSAAVDLSEAEGYGEHPQVAVDSQGDAVAVWQATVGEYEIIQSAARPAGGSWSAAVDVSETGQNAFEPQVAVDSQGDAVAVWQRYNGSHRVVQSASRPAGGGWSAAADLSETGQSAEEPQVAVNSQGDAAAVWQRFNGTSEIAQGATRPAGGSWSAAVDLSAPGEDARGPQVAVDPQGDAVAVWQRSNGTDRIVQSARHPAGGSWSAAVDLSAPGEDARGPQVAVDPQGDAVAVWDRYSIIQAAVYDATGPQLGSLSIPANGTAGEPLSFSVSPLDLWSALGATSWSFGDGGSASGTAATYAYAAAGTYQVTVTAADVLGNPTSATGTVTVAASPTTPPPTTVTTAGSGRAYVAPLARRKGNGVLLRLRCRGAGRCLGAVKLLSGGKSIGKRRFGIASGRAKTLRVKLNSRGRALVRRSHGRRLKLKLTGIGVKHRVVVVKGT